MSFTVGRRDRLSLAGPNGAGKTTLLRAIAGETSLQGGKLAFAKGTRMALHDQRPPLEFDLTLREYALSGARDLLKAEAELRSLEEAMAAGAHDEVTLRRYADAQARLEHAGGWGWRDHAAATIRGLGFAEDDLDRPLGTFSGGELTRASLARVLAGGPDLLLLDEPTNHLDVQNLEWLERELETIDAAVILVAHDRWFLEAVTTSVLELTPARAHYFAGPWHEWRREKASRAAAAEKTVDRVAEDIERIGAIWREARERFGAAGPFLFGSYGAADAMYTPVASRFRTYGVALDPICQAYADAVLSWPAQAGKNYRVQYCDQVATGNWQNLTTAVQVAGGQGWVTVSRATPTRVYRVRCEP